MMFKGCSALVGCSAALAGVSFAVGLLISLLATVTWREGLAWAGGLACLTFMAALISGLSDRARDKAVREAVCGRLMARDDLADEAFLAAFDPADRELALLLRARLAGFFGVPPAKIAPDDRLSAFAPGDLGAGAYVAVMMPFIKGPWAPREAEVRRLGPGLDSLSELIREAKEVAGRSPAGGYPGTPR